MWIVIHRHQQDTGHRWTQNSLWPELKRTCDHLQLHPDMFPISVVQMVLHLSDVNHFHIRNKGAPPYSHDWSICICKGGKSCSVAVSANDLVWPICWRLLILGQLHTYFYIYILHIFSLSIKHDGLIKKAMCDQFWIKMSFTCFMHHRNKAGHESFVYGELENFIPASMVWHAIAIN